MFPIGENVLKEWDAFFCWRLKWSKANRVNNTGVIPLGNVSLSHFSSFLSVCWKVMIFSCPPYDVFTMDGQERCPYLPMNHSQYQTQRCLVCLQCLHTDLMARSRDRYFSQLDSCFVMFPYCPPPRLWWTDGCSITIWRSLLFVGKNQAQATDTVNATDKTDDEETETEGLYTLRTSDGLLININQTCQQSQLKMKQTVMRLVADQQPGDSISALTAKRHSKRNHC